MEQPTRIFQLAGAVFGLLAVAAGAFGAHALKGKLTPDQLDSFMTAARYQLVHAILLVFLPLLPRTRLTELAGWLFAVGILFFAGSIYLLTLANASWVWPITPIGGLLLMAGWAMLVIHLATNLTRSNHA